MTYDTYEQHLVDDEDLEHEPRDRDERWDDHMDGPGQLEQEPEPVDLDEAGALYNRVLGEIPVAALPDVVTECLSFVPGLVVELHELREELAEWQDRETETEVAVAVGGRPDDEDAFVAPCEDVGQAEKVADLLNGEVFMRTTTVHPWRSMNEPPF